jgi:D-threo-aldose 1-dehydrogenase
VTAGRLGFGCAGAFVLPRKQERHALLAAALDAGIRHFDVAPMYGLGLAEAELGSVVGAHRDQVTLTTKFGINVTPIGRAAGRLQRPVRSVLARRPALHQGLSASGRGPASGLAGRVLYDAPGFGAASAARSLGRSLAALGTDYVDFFALHDPGNAGISHPAALIDFLEGRRRDRVIRSWGIAADLPPTGDGVATLMSQAGMRQCRDDVFDTEPDSAATSTLITYGCLSRALPATSTYFRDVPGAAKEWSTRFDRDVTDVEQLAGVLLREALRRNPSGLVVFATTKPDRIAKAVESAAEGVDDDAEREAVRGLVGSLPDRHPPSGASH